MYNLIIQSAKPKPNEISKNPIVIDFDLEKEVTFLEPQALEKTFKEQNKKNSLDESNTKLCSCCEDNSVAAYYCEDCKDELCQSCFQAQKIVKIARNHTITVTKDITSDINESAIKICTGCENDLLASYYCIQFSENICEQCFDAHKKVKLTKKHTLNPCNVENIKK